MVTVRGSGRQYLGTGYFLLPPLLLRVVVTVMVRAALVTRGSRLLQFQRRDWRRYLGMILYSWTVGMVDLGRVVTIRQTGNSCRCCEVVPVPVPVPVPETTVEP